MVSKPITARRRLELSQLNPAAIQRETMGIDVDFAKFTLYLSSQIQTDVNGRITAATIERTIEGASTLSVTINDWDRALERSGLLSQRIDVQIDGLWFRLVGADKSGSTDELTLTFEDREIAILRTYNTWRIVQRGVMTRAEFILSLLREVKEYKYELGKNAFIPELHKIQPIEKYQGDLVGIDSVMSKAQGIAKDINNTAGNERFDNHPGLQAQREAAFLTVKGAVADQTQIQNANIVLAVGDDMGVNRRVKVIAIMTAITESTLHNLPGGDNAHGGGTDDSAGMFQQTITWGSYAERTDVETAARLFYTQAVKVDIQNPNEPYWFICAETQHPREDLRTQYAKWRTEAERFVNAQGDVSNVQQSNAMALNLNTFSDVQPFYFYRGTIVDKRGLKVRKPEDSWDCMQRLADEVDWRAFFVSGSFYWISEDDLFKQIPLGTYREFTPGLNDVSGSYISGKKSATLTLKAEIGRWQVPPGSVITLKDIGPWNGRWLVNDYTRDLIGSNREATITLKKPRPELPEPLASNASDLGTGASWLPQTQTYVPPTKDLITQVLTSPRIHFSNPLETSDVQFSKIDDRVLQSMLFMADRGYEITVTALRSDHANLTSEGNISAHSVGKAEDIGKVGSVLMGDNDTTSRMMDFLALYQVQLGFDQLIGPFPQKCLPVGRYDALTLSQHKNHIHVGWPI